MDNAQLQQLLQVIRVGGGGHKTSKFSSAEGTEWRIWRRNFEQTIQINAWPNERCQRKAAAAMESNVSNEAASQSILAHEAGSGGKGNVASIIHLEDEGALVLDCGSYDHQIATCPLARPDQHRDSNKPRGRGRPRGGRGGCGRGGGQGGGVGFKRTYLQTRGRGGTRGAPVRKGFNNNSNRNGGVNGVGGEDEQYESYCNELDTTRNGGINGIGDEDEQYEDYCNELDTLDTISLKIYNGEPDQESWEEDKDDHYVDYNLYNLDTLSLNKADRKPEEESWEENEDRTTTTTNDDQVHGCRWAKDWNEAEKEEIHTINQHFTRGGVTIGMR
jgi:hypothetical protein